MPVRCLGRWVLFQSTHPVRGATGPGDEVLRFEQVISIHAPREGCDSPTSKACIGSGISIHAPREGCDIGCR